MIYGHPQIKVEDDQTDRIGIRTLVLSQLWQPSHWPMTLAELDAEKPNIPEVPGGVLFVGEQTRRVRGASRTTWTFEGINGDGKSVTFKDRANSIDYWFEGGFAERNILRLPGIQDLMDQYGGQPVDGSVLWQPLVPDDAASNGAVKNNQAGKANPLFGHDTYFSLDGTYHFRYAATSMASLQAWRMTILESGALPGQAPSFRGRNWLPVPPQPRRVGPVFEIVESFWLSGDGGWPAPIYKPTKGGTGGNSGLQTGSL